MTSDPHAAGPDPDDAVTNDESAFTDDAAIEEFLDDAPASVDKDGHVGVGDPAASVGDDTVDGDAADGERDDAGGDDAGGVDPVIAGLTAERDEFKNIAQRVQAEFDNYRKRSATQQRDEVDRATGAFAESLLPVLDAAEAAYVAHPDEVGPLFNLLLTELRKRGLEPMNLLDQPFDPNLADAVAHEPGDGAEPRVTEVLRSGYTWKGKTLRAAMVRTTD